jgi:type IV secretion system protein VirB11
MTVAHDEFSTLKNRTKEKLRRDLGEAVLEVLHDPKTVEIMLNADGLLWLEQLGEPMRCIGRMAPARAEAIIKTISGFHGKEVTRWSPLLEAELPLDGSRFAGQLPPVVSAPTFAIRKRAVSIFTLQQYVDAGLMTPRQCEVMKMAIREHRNILVTGGTGSGKTTLVNAIINEMVVQNDQERLVIIEDTGEIQCAAQNVVQYHSTLEVSMTMLLKTTLRMRPDRILVGEVRGPEALDLLMAWNTGHEGGAATIHANHARAGLDRLRMLISMHQDAPDDIEPLIANVVNVIVHIERTPTGRRIREIVRLNGYRRNDYVFEEI